MKCPKCGEEMWCEESDFGKIAGKIGGAAVGFLVGGPVGAGIGFWALHRAGSMAGGKVLGTWHCPKCDYTI